MPTYFDPNAPIAFLSGDLPHWRQEGATYFITFRLADSLPQERLKTWQEEKKVWITSHPEPHDEQTYREYYELFPQRLQNWLDAGFGSCVLLLPEVKHLVESALWHFDEQRYRLHEFAVAPNHVHVLISPLRGYTMSKILHAWKSFTAHEILKIDVARQRLRDGSATVSSIRVWQKESFDHIVRNAESMGKFRAYIQDHHAESGGVLL